MPLPPKCSETWYLCEEASRVVVVEPSSSKLLAVEQGAGSLRAALRKACNQPLDRRPRRPRLLQVETEAQAAALAGVIPAVVITVAPPPPDLHELLSPRGEGAGPKPLAGIAALAWAGVRFAAAVPWKVLGGVALPVEAPELGLARGVALILGELEESFGLLLFESEEAWERHAAWAEHADWLDDQTPSSFLAFELERARDLEPKQRRVLEAVVGKHKRLAVATRAHGRRLEPADERETRLLVAVAEAIAAMTRDVGGEIFHETVTEWEHGLVRIDVSEIGDEPDEPDEPDEEQVFGVDFFTVGDEVDRPEALRLLGRIAAWCDQELPEAYDERVIEAVVGDDGHPLSVALELWPLLLLELVEGRSFVDHFTAASALTPAEEAIITAQRQAWNGLWQVRSVASARVLEMVELLSGERRLVREPEEDTLLRPGTLICARVIELGGEALITASRVDCMNFEQDDGLAPAARMVLGWSEARPMDLGELRRLETQMKVLEWWSTATRVAVEQMNGDSITS